VFDHGRIVEQGTHQSLLHQRGYYAALVKKSAMQRSDEVVQNRD
jgi:ABC-type multidrug transport system fused ATPase/permease subunit